MPGLWCFLDVCNDTMTPYMDGTYDTDEENFSETLKKARNFIANHKLEEAMLGNYNPTICIFDLKNNHGYTDRIESKSDITSGGDKIVPDPADWKLMREYMESKNGKRD